MILVLIVLLLAILVYGSKACADTLVQHHEESIFSQFDQYSFFGLNSWVRKYKNMDQSQGEAFKWSTTYLAFTTDAWHMFNLILKIGYLGLTVVTFSLGYHHVTLFKLLTYYSIFLTFGSIVFTTLYNYLLIKK